MGHQSTFDRVVGHLRRQNARAMGAFGICVYRAANGRRCAVGCLIPDDKYSASLEGQSLELETHTELRAILEEEGHDVNLIRQLQMIHDTVLIHHWEVEFAKLGARYKLDFRPKQMREGSNTGPLTRLTPGGQQPVNSVNLVQIHPN